LEISGCLLKGSLGKRIVNNGMKKHPEGSKEYFAQILLCSQWQQHRISAEMASKSD